MSELTYEQKERIAIQVAHLPEEEADAEYAKLCKELETKNEHLEKSGTS